VRDVTRSSGIAAHVRVQGGDPFDISPDGKEFAVVANSDKTGVLANPDIYLVPTAGGAAKNITPDNKASDSDPLFSPDGKRLAFEQQRIYGFYGDTARLMILDRASGKIEGIAEKFDRSVSGLVWREDGTGLYAAIGDAGVRRVFRIDLRGAAPAPLTGAEDFDGLALAGVGRGEVLVGLRQSFDYPAELVRIDPRTGAATKLSTFNDTILAKADRGKVESVTYKGANGADIQMWVIYPPGFDPSKKYPLMLLLHGGPHNGITNAWTYRWNAHLFAGWGYVVAWHNFHGSSTFGQAFTDSITKNWMDLPYEDTIKAADWFLAKPWIDNTRTIAAGASYGGYLAAVLLGKPHPFNALVAHAPVYNHYTQLASDGWANQGRYPEYWEDRPAFEQSSPHLYAANFKTPTLVIHGGEDLRVPVNNGMELFQTLQKRGVPSKYVYYPDENHWILKPQNSIHWYGEVRAWVENYAPPGPQAPAAAIGASGK
jgi:dipeptidyl aminopeptidase/acylaminoacyl peptidase